MAKPPPSGPSSDIEGANRDARAGAPSKSSQPEPGSALRDADKQSKAQPDKQADRD